MNFEPAVLENIDEMLKIEKKSFASHWNRQTFFDELSAENGYYIVIKDNDRIMGYSGFRYVLDEAHITTLAVHHKFRKKGIGSKLIEQLIKDAKARGLKKLFLEVRQSNMPAQKIYKRLGFKVLDRRREYYQHPVEDALVMQNDNF
ncbi:MAG: ribosomal protein S18-alanine N-acetyltransferase [Candidatus Margulisiibacteriota bacterium]